MRCPACRQLLNESAPACSHCGFDLAATIRVLGAAPQLHFPLSDFTGTISLENVQRVTRELLDMTQTFSQLRFAAVICPVDARIPLAAHAFWLFNTGGLNSSRESGSNCRLVLLELDVTNSRAACMIGYGLEPFIPQDALNRIAVAAVPDLQKGDPPSAILAALEMAQMEFAAVSQSIAKASGLPTATHATASESDEAAFAY